MRRRIWFILACAGAGVPACTTGPHAGAEARATGEPAALVRLAESQRRSPRRVDRARVLAALGEDAAWLRDGAAPAQGGARSLDEVVAALAAEPLGWLEQPPPNTPPTDAARTEAARLYAAGRLQRLGGEALEAAGTLDRASRLDPTSERILEERGEAQLAAGLDGLARQSFRRAVALGSNNPRALLVVARDEHEAGRVEHAAGLAARALLASEERDESRALSLGLLAETLPELDRPAAGGEAARRALHALRRLTTGRSAGVDPRFAPDLQALARRTASLGVAAGDQALLAGDPARAAEDYLLGASGSGAQAGLTESRRLLALTLAGRTGEAALTLIDAIRREPGPLTGRRLTWLHVLAQADPRTAEPLRDALRRLAAEQADAPPSVRESLDLAAAAIDGSDPIEHLRGWIAQHGLSGRVIDAAFGDRAGAPAIERAVLLTSLDPARAREIAGELLLRTDDVALLRRALLADTTPPGRLLHAAVVLEMGYPEAAPSEPPPDRSSPALAAAWNAVRGEAAAARGDWNEHARSLRALRRDAGHEAALLRVLVAGQRLEEARALAERIAARPDAAARDALNAAALAELAGDAPAQARWLREAIRLDPYEPEPYASLVALHASNGRLPDREAFVAVGRQLRDRLPRAAELTLLAAGEQIQRGLPAEAEAALLAIEDAGRNPRVLEMLTLAWTAGHRRGDAEALRRGREFLSPLVDRYPLRPEPATRLAEVFAAGGDFADAERVLAGAADRLGHHEIRRLREHVLRQSGDGAGAGRLARERLTTRGRGIGLALELALLATQTDEPALARKAIAGLPPEAELLAPQREALLQAAHALATQAVRNGLAPEDAPRIAAALAIHDEAARRGLPLAAERRQMLIRVRAAAPILDLEALRRDAEAGVGEGLEPSTAYGVAAGALLAAERVDPAMVLLGRAVTGDGLAGPRPELTRLWLELIGRFGAAGDAEDAVSAIAAAGLLADAARIARLRPPEEGETDARRRAEILYTAATFATLLDRPEALEMYEAVLAADPTHAWAANDLGYQLATEGRRLDEAERLLEQALRHAPDEPAMLDSLGWVRYKLGVLEDESPGSGREVREGAVTLLSRAVQLDDEPSPVMFRQLGDALFRTGRRDEAFEAWSKGLERATQQLRQSGGARGGGAMNEVGAGDGDAGRAGSREVELARSLSDRVSAIRRGAEPPLAPVSSPRAPNAASETEATPSPDDSSALPSVPPGGGASDDIQHRRPARTTPAATE